MTYVGKTIGLRNLTWFPMLADPDTEEGETKGKPKYGAAQFLSRAIDLELSPQIIEALLESDDGVEDDMRIAASYEVVMHASQLTDAIRSALMGHANDDHGGVLFSRTDTPAVGALAFRALLSKESGDDDKYVYVVLYKGRLQEFSEKFETLKKEGITFQTHSGIRGTFVPRDTDGAIMYRLREDEADDDNAVATKITNWFTAPQEVATVTPAT